MLSQASQWAGQGESKESYAYDERGRLTEVQETPAGKGCTTRLYAYDEDGNRTSLVTREPGSEGKCGSEDSSIQSYAYDTADRVDESGVAYDPFGDITTLPAGDAGGSALTSSYFANGALASEEQNGDKNTYTLDPAGRDSIIQSKEGSGLLNTVNEHYTGPEGTPAWAIHVLTRVWTRYIAGVGGGLTACETKGDAPELQLANLHGDIIATAKLTETEPTPTPANETTEYGVPRTTVTAKYSWLGTEMGSTERPTGIINMGARTYVPELGRFEQPDPQPGGSVNAYGYTFDDPVNEADPTGEWSTYDYENAQTGEAEAGTLRDGIEPGAIVPPPADYQAEAAESVELFDPTIKLTVPQAFTVAEWLKGASVGIDEVPIPMPILDLLKAVVAAAGEYAAEEIEIAARKAKELNSCLTRKAQKKYGMYGVEVSFGLQFGIPPWYFDALPVQGHILKRSDGGDPIIGRRDDRRVGPP